MGCTGNSKAIPPELLKEKGWDEGTKLKIEVGDLGTLILTEIT